MESALNLARREAATRTPVSVDCCDCPRKGLQPNEAHHVLEGQGVKVRCPKCQAKLLTPHQARVAGLGQHLEGHEKAPSAP